FTVCKAGHRRRHHSKLNEIAFSAALISELGAISRAKPMQRKLRDLALHAICSPEAARPMSALSRLNTQSASIKALYKACRTQAEAWLGDSLPACRSAPGEREKL